MKITETILQIAMAILTVCAIGLIVYFVQITTGVKDTFSECNERYPEGYCMIANENATSINDLFSDCMNVSFFDHYKFYNDTRIICWRKAWQPTTYT